MKFSIIPITYLICLSILLTPITFIIINQIFTFNRNKLYIKEYEDQIISFNINYKLAKIYIYNKKWHLALIILENDVYRFGILNNQSYAKYYNTIGFILQNINYSVLAKKYYLKSLQSDSTYLLAEKNLHNLNK